MKKFFNFLYIAYFFAMAPLSCSEMPATVTNECRAIIPYRPNYKNSAEHWKHIEYLSTPEYLKKEMDRVSTYLDLPTGLIRPQTETTKIQTYESPAVIEWTHTEGKITYLGEEHTDPFCTQVIKELTRKNEYDVFLEEHALLASFIFFKNGTLEDEIKSQAASQESKKHIQSIADGKKKPERIIIDPTLEEIKEIAETTEAGFSNIVMGAYSKQDIVHFGHWGYTPCITISADTILPEKFTSNMEALEIFIRDAWMIKKIREKIIGLASNSTKTDIFITNIGEKIIELHNNSIKTNVFIRMGRSHLINQEEALRSLYGKTEAYIYRNNSDPSPENWLKVSSVHEELNERENYLKLKQSEDFILLSEASSVLDALEKENYPIKSLTDCFYLNKFYHNHKTFISKIESLKKRDNLNENQKNGIKQMEIYHQRAIKNFRIKIAAGIQMVGYIKNCNPFEEQTMVKNMDINSMIEALENFKELYSELVKDIVKIKEKKFWKDKPRFHY